MSNNPGDTPDEPEDGGQNPFRGTPFEQFFGSAGLGGSLGGGPGGMPDLGALFSQIQSLMQPYDGPINWDFALDTARKIVAQNPDPSPTQKQKDAVADAVRLADLWLDDTTTFPSGISSTAAWSRAEWIVGTTDVWKVLVEPIAEGSVQALGSALPEEARAASGPMLGILGKAVGAMLASQVGSGLGGPAAGERRDVRRGARRLRGRRAALPGAPRGRPPAALRARAVAARAPDRRRRRLRPRHGDQRRRDPGPHRGADARRRPDQPGVDAAAPRGRHVRPAPVPSPDRGAAAPRGHPRIGRGLGRRGGQPGHPRA